MEGEAWRAPPENTLESLRHAIVHFDGIEFDVRITADGHLVVHHDREVSVPPPLIEGRPLWVEEWSLADLEGLGFLSFEALLDDAVVQREWVEHGKMGCVEIKRPHPKASSGGGYRGRKQHNQHVATAMKLAEAALDQREIPAMNTVFYAFHKGMPDSAALSATNRPWAALIPYIPPYGTRTTQRLQAFPQYLTTPFRRLVNRHQRQGSSMLPCAVEYVQAGTKHLAFGRHVGLNGNGYHRLNRARRGMATYVWPTRPELEHAMLRAGMTGLTDHADPNLTWLPSGQPRWRQPGTRPLTEDEWQTLLLAKEGNHRTVLKELEAGVPTWSQADDERKRRLVTEWKERWRWPSEVETVLQQHTEATPPWAAPRLIGHRGCGKTSRPVLNPHSR